MEDFFFINTCKSNNFFPFAWSKLLCAQLSVQIRRFEHFEQTPDHKQFSDRVQLGFLQLESVLERYRKSVYCCSAEV